jgi:putative DNA primase/helicase
MGMVGGLSSALSRAETVELFKCIPTELRERDQWAVWRYERRNGKTTKVPYQTWAKVFRPAKCNDPATWGTFGAAITVYEFCKYDGILYALTETDPYSFIDLDKCRDPDTGAIEEWALEIIRDLNSYAEVSHSGTGIHIFVRGKLPAGRRREGQIEMYDSGRFAAMTGRRLEFTP